MKPTKLLASFVAVLAALIVALFAIGFVASPAPALSAEKVEARFRIDNDLNAGQYALLDDVVASVPESDLIPSGVYAVRVEVFDGGKSLGFVYFSVLGPKCGQGTNLVLLSDDGFEALGAKQAGGAEWIDKAIAYVCSKVPAAVKPNGA